jgi:hypothetical protein
LTRLATAHLLLAAGIAFPTLAGAEQPSTAAERSRAVAWAKELEAHPLAEDAAEKRRVLIKWYERVPDVTVTVCDLLGPFPAEGASHPVFTPVLVQLMLAGGAFVIEHPNEAADMVAVQTAAVGGALRVYDRLAPKYPDHRLPYLDDLLKKREAGTLAAHLKERVPEQCRPQ